MQRPWDRRLWAVVCLCVNYNLHTVPRLSSQACLDALQAQRTLITPAKRLSWPDNLNYWAS